MYRGLGALGQDEEPFVVPEEGVYATPPHDVAPYPGDVVPYLPAPAEFRPAPSSGSSGSVFVDIGRVFSGIISGITGGGSVRVQVPGQQGYPGSGGCQWNQCPTQGPGPIILCQPCASPAAFIPTSVTNTVAGVTSASWFWPVAILAVLLLATSGRRR